MHSRARMCVLLACAVAQASLPVEDEDPLSPSGLAALHALLYTYRAEGRDALVVHTLTHTLTHTLARVREHAVAAGAHVLPPVHVEAYEARMPIMCGAALELYMHAGRAFERLGDIPAAFSVYSSMLQCDASHFGARMNAAVLQLQHGSAAPGVRMLMDVSARLYEEGVDARVPPQELLAKRLLVARNQVAACIMADQPLSAMDAALRCVHEGAGWRRCGARTDRAQQCFQARIVCRLDQLLRQHDAAGALQLFDELVAASHAAQARRMLAWWAGYDAEWHGLQRLVQACLHAGNAGACPSLPVSTYQFLMWPSSPAQQRALADAHARIRACGHHGLECALPVRTTAVASRRPLRAVVLGNADAHAAHAHTLQQPRVPLRVGVLIFDVNDHPSAFMLGAVSEHAAAHGVTIYTLAYGPPPSASPINALLRHTTAYVDLHDLSDPAALQRIRELQLDLVVDAQGHTRRVRSELHTLVARELLTVSHIATPGTLGQGAAGFAIVDAHVLDVTAAATQFAETTVYLPQYYVHMWRPHAPKHARGTRPAPVPARTPFVFANFNKPEKLEPVTFSAWMNVLARTPHSRLQLLVPSYDAASVAATRAHFLAEAAARGVHPSRIDVLPWTDTRSHADRLADVDLFLDSFVCGAHATALDVADAGIPILTLKGDVVARRVAASLNSHRGFNPSLVVNSMHEYENVAVRAGALRRVPTPEVATDGGSHSHAEAFARACRAIVAAATVPASGDIK